MTVRTLNRVLWIAMLLIAICIATIAIAGLFERPFRLSAYVSHFVPLIIFPAMFPAWIKVMRQREETYGLDGKLPPSSMRRFKIALIAICSVALIAVGAAAYVAAYLRARHGV